MKWLTKMFGGQDDMAALKAGAKAPDFTLSTLDGKPFSLAQKLSEGPVVLAFFKVSCPVCQYAFPFLERLHKAYGDRGVKVIGVSQDNKSNTAAFIKQFGITFPVLLDPADSFTVSNNYGLTNVPTVFWINTDSEIETSSVGWIKVDFEQINRMMAEHLHATPSAVFQPGEDVRDFRSG
jgi:peroxiredoxin